MIEGHFDHIDHVIGSSRESIVVSDAGELETAYKQQYRIEINIALLFLYVARHGIPFTDLSNLVQITKPPFVLRTNKDIQEINLTILVCNSFTASRPNENGDMFVLTAGAESIKSQYFGNNIDIPELPNPTPFHDLSEEDTKLFLGFTNIVLDHFSTDE